MAGHAERIDVYGPRGLDDYVRDITRSSETHFSYPAEVHVIEAGTVFEDEEFTVSGLPPKHRVRTFGYRVVERDRAGAFDVERAVAAGIPPGPLYGRLKRGERITLPDGREVEADDLLAEARAVFPRTELAHDFLTVDVPRRRSNV